MRERVDRHKAYVARLYEKLGASNRAQAIMTALKLELLS
ncbi:response regulator transcription factor [Kribbella sp. VKM Ac-2568]|nr:response regulator transcription factor [Kribbella sp. VKM Ac-2568]